MKTIEEFIKEIEGSAALQDELKAVRDKDALAAFLKKNDVDGTIEDFGKVVKAKTEAEGEITDDAAEAVAGGFNWREYIASTADDAKDDEGSFYWWGDYVTSTAFGSW